MGYRKLPEPGLNQRRRIVGYIFMIGVLAASFWLLARF
jgi:hypothetical protein